MKVFGAPLCSALTLVFTVGCGAAQSADPRGTPSFDNTTQHQPMLQEQAVDLDAFFNDAATQRYMRAAAEEGSPCAPLLGDVIALAKVLAPAFSKGGSPDYGVILANLPQILATAGQLIACVQSQQSGNGGAGQTGGNTLPPAPLVPAYDPFSGDCTTVTWFGKTVSACPK